MLLNNNPNLQIDSLYAILAESENGEGIMAAEMPINGKNMLVPLVVAKLELLNSLIPVANRIAKASGRSFRIYKFDNKTDITEQFDV